MPNKRYKNIMSTVASGKGDTLVPEKYKKYFVKKKKAYKPRPYPEADIL